MEKYAGQVGEKGQSLVLIAIALLAMIAFMALAIDVGMLYSERASAQNAADSAAFAAAVAGSQGGGFEDAALSIARLNGYDDDSPTVDVEVNRTVNGNDKFYHVKIRSQYKPYFAYFIYTGTLENTVEAVARANKGGGGGLGGALIATSGNACQAMCLGGTLTFNGKKGSIFSNSNLVGNGTTDPCHSLAVHGNAKVKMTEGASIQSVGSYYKFGGSGSVTLESPGSIQENQPPLGDLSHLYITEPSTCLEAAKVQPSFGHGVKDVTYTPGHYTGGIALSGSPNSVTFESGVYCVDGGMTLTLGKVTGNNVFFYIRSGEFRIQAQSDVNLTGYTGGAYTNELMYMPVNNQNLVRVAGGSTLTLTGRIMALGPRESLLTSDQCAVETAPYKCELVGNSTTTTINSQVICDTVRVKGTTTMTVTYNDPSAAGSSTILELNK